MRKRQKLGSLSVAETQRLLGSKPPVSIGKLPTHGLGMRFAPLIVRERLVSRGGRPSDPAWTIVKKVPMRPETWKEFNRCAQELQSQRIRVSAGQIAAITLERGLQITMTESKVTEQEVRQSEAPYATSDAAMIETVRAYQAFSSNMSMYRSEHAA